MAAFSFQQQNHPLCLDSVFYSNLPNSSFFPQFYRHENLQQHYSMNFNTVHDESRSSSLEQSSNVISHTNSLTTKQSPTCSSVVLESTDEIRANQKLLISPTDKKRKYKKGSPSNSSAQSKNTTRDQVKKKAGKKQKRSNNGDVEEDKKDNDEEGPSPPTGYIHVRARRGQATDSHSLAERVRREKISERMKLLQAIVPGCDKVTGKALMLDEIINYVQSLQNQVEFLSMKLASENPMFYDFGVDLDAFMVKPQSITSLEPQMPNVQQSSPTGSASTFPRPNSYSLVDSSASASLVLQQAQLMPNIHSQGNRQVSWGMDDRRQKLIDQSTLSNSLFSFH